MKKNENILSIGAAAEFLGVSIQTLRRWDKSGRLKAEYTGGGHRYYKREVLEKFKENLFLLARVWAESSKPSQLPEDYYSQTQDVFRARLDTIAVILDMNKNTKDIAPLLVAVAGEIGNNSFDHNFGNWPDEPGIFFAYDANKRVIVLADRGIGIKATLSRVRPDLKDDIMALRVAFTERISGRSPEQRGNGLKFVREVAVNHPVGVMLQSGTAVAEIARDEGKLVIKLAERNIPGTLAKITY